MVHSEKVAEYKPNNLMEELSCTNLQSRVEYGEQTVVFPFVVLLEPSHRDAQ